jgi:hypothetical protein
MAEFQCPYAPPGQRRCPEWICDCFIDTHPDDPFGLHPEDFLVDGHRYDLNGHMADCPGCPAVVDVDERYL